MGGDQGKPGAGTGVRKPGAGSSNAWLLVGLAIWAWN